MFDSETRWFIRCDTCPDDGSKRSRRAYRLSNSKDTVAAIARDVGWDIGDDLHRCPRCVRENRMEKAP